MGLFERLLDKACHDHVAAHIDVLAEIEARRRYSEPEFDRLCGFPWKGATNGPFIADGCQVSDQEMGFPDDLDYLLKPAGA